MTPMGWIYKIYNDVNDKVYIGQTVRNVERRWQEHLNNAKNHLKERKYAIYEAMNKYGIDKFHIEILKECPNNELNDYEKAYIKEYNSVAPNGYNLTYGGDGNIRLDYDWVIEKYYECNQNEAELYRKYKIHPITTKYILHNANIIPQPNYEKFGVEVYECDVDNNVIKIFPNYMAVHQEYKDLGITIEGLSNYFSHQLNQRQKTYKGKYFCRAYDYEQYKTKDHHSHVKTRKVRCSNGMEFDKLADAARWIQVTYPEYKGSVDTIAANISKAIKAHHNSYKHSWIFIDI